MSNELMRDDSSIQFKTPATVDVLGTPISLISGYEDACHVVARSIETRHRCLCVAVNPEKVEAASRHDVLRNALALAQLRIADGIGVVAAVKFLHGSIVGRVTGVELFTRLIDKAAASGWRVYLLGASPEVNVETARILNARHPSLEICGSMHGYFTNEQAAVDDVNNANPDLLFVAMGSPRQEEWICRHWKILNVPFCMGVGGTFDVVSGNVRRAPQWCRKLGVEWLYRLVTQPSRWRRQLALPRFAARVAWEKCRPRRNASPMHANFD